MSTLIIPAAPGDGTIAGSNADYNIAHSTADHATVDGPLGMGCIGQERYGTGEYNCRRTYLHFDTSAIGDQDMKWVKMCLTAHEDLAEDAEFDIRILDADWAYPLDGDMDANFDLGLSAANYVVWGNTALIPLNTPILSPELDKTYINTSGYTRYALVSSRDADGVHAAGDTFHEHVHVCRANFAVEAYRPYLVVKLGRPLWVPNPLGCVDRVMGPLGV